MKTICILSAGFIAAAAAMSGCAARAPGPSSATLSLGQQGRIGSVALRPIKVLEDSRCPVEVTCVWAGRLRVKAVLTSDGKSRTVEFASDNRSDAANGGVSLVSACPVQHRERTIGPGGYRFIFVAPGADPAGFRLGC